MMSEDLFERAAALGIRVVAREDLDALLEAVHEREHKLMLLRHAIERRIVDGHASESP